MDPEISCSDCAGCAERSAFPRPQRVRYDAAAPACLPIFRAAVLAFHVEYPILDLWEPMDDLAARAIALSAPPLAEKNAWHFSFPKAQNRSPVTG